MKYENTKIIITKNMVDETYIVKWLKEQKYFLQYEKNPKIEWGINANTFKQLLKELEKDKQEGYLNDFKIVLSSSI